MRLLGLLLACVGSAGVVYGVRMTMSRGRPSDLVFAMLTWVCVIIALFGVGLLFAPTML
jgi:hypothetical protein